jgi:hypothetical protein
MKLNITFYDSGIKKNTSKARAVKPHEFFELIALLEKSFANFLLKNCE